MKLLLHTCCAPCAIYPIKEAKSKNFSVTGFFYNSNIHPQSEYIKRKEETKALFKSEGLEVLYPTYNTCDFFDNIKEKNKKNRCSDCWNLRLKETVSFAEHNSFDAFTSTLLGSPYQDHETIKETCEDLSRGKNVRFYYKDFRVGFRDAHQEARKKGIYCQNYCGCVFSIVDRAEAKKGKAVNALSR